MTFLAHAGGGDELFVTVAAIGFYMAARGLVAEIRERRSHAASKKRDSTA
ncbi:MAG TPA: hypothetical protein VF660_02850 [Actinomycetota bacterium]